jgi:hypothetical protein
MDEYRCWCPVCDALIDARDPEQVRRHRDPTHRPADSAMPVKHGRPASE